MSRRYLSDPDYEKGIRYAEARAQHYAQEGQRALAAWWRHQAQDLAAELQQARAAARERRPR